MPKREPISKVTLSDGSVRYRIRVDAGYHLDGRRKQVHRTFRTYKEAVAGLASIRTQAPKGEFIGRESVTCAKYFASWLSGKRKLRASTSAYYANVSRPFLETYGDLPVQSLTKAHFESAVNEIISSGRGASYVKGFLVAWGQVMDSAVSEQIVRTNYARLVDKPSLPLPSPNTWTADEAATFMSSIEGHPWEALWRLTMAGLRRGEVLGLTWDQIDLGAGKLSIETTRVIVDGKVVPSGPKTMRGWRVLPIWPALADSLARHQPQTGLLATEANRPIDPGHYSKTFKRLARQAGLPAIPLKNARHTSVTLLRNQGVPDHIVAAWHGHSETVMRTYYSEAQVGMMQAAAALM
jgi:integrase